MTKQEKATRPERERGKELGNKPDRTAFVIEESLAEVVTGDGTKLWLLADSSDACGVLGANRIRLEKGVDGAKMHYHKLSSEAFYVLDGVLKMVIEGKTVMIGKGGYVIIPPGVKHSFAATADAVADLFVTLVPGVERFEYFRMLPSIMRGELDEQKLHDVHVSYDVYFTDT